MKKHYALCLLSVLEQSQTIDMIFKKSLQPEVRDLRPENEEATQSENPLKNTFVSKVSLKQYSHL